jgi:hypothetical protein
MGGSELAGFLAAIRFLVCDVTPQLWLDSGCKPVHCLRGASTMNPTRVRSSYSSCSSQTGFGGNNSPNRGRRPITGMFRWPRRNRERTAIPRLATRDALARSCNVIRQQRRICGVVLGRPRPIVCPMVGAALVIGDALFQQLSARRLKMSASIRPSSRDPPAAQHHDSRQAEFETVSQGIRRDAVSSTKIATLAPIRSLRIF